MGVGSGIVVSGDGIVLTASHVVESGRGMRRNRRGNATDRAVTITFPNGKQYPASILGKNGDADAAVLKMTELPDDGSQFPHAEMGRTTDTTVGEWCFALGHPGGFRPDREAPVRIWRTSSTRRRSWRE
jgi:serine protease Do